MPITANLHPQYYQAQGEDGPYTATAFGVACTNSRGDRWVHFASTNQATAERLLARVQARIAARPNWVPDAAHWHSDQPVYGSEAYQRGSGEQYLARLDVEAEDGAGAYQPDHPGFIG